MRCASLALAAAITSGCSPTDVQLEHHAQKVASLRATTLSITEAWLKGDVTGTYAEAALDQAFQLLQKERAAVASTPTDLARPSANALSRDAETMSRVVAALTRDIQSGDGANARRHLHDLRAATPQQP